MKKIDVIKFYPKKYYEQMKNKNSKPISLDDFREYISEYLKNSDSINFNIYKHYRYIRLNFIVRISEKDLVSIKSDRAEDNEVLKNQFVYSVAIDVVLKNNSEEIEKIKEVFNIDNLTLERNIKSEEADSYIDKLKKFNKGGKLVFLETPV